MSESYRDLVVWQQSRALALEIYRCTKMFPKDEVYGLSLQMRRAAVSVPSNIAEGKGRHSHKELVQFLYRARGSLLELETQLSIARDLGYLDEKVGGPLEELTGEVGRLLNGLVAHFEAQVARSFLTPDTRNLTPETKKPTRTAVMVGRE